MSAQWEAQKALYDQLSADSTFMNLIGDRLYDEPPTNNTYPYVVVGDAIEIPDDTILYRGYDTSVTFKIYTKPAGLGSYTSKQILEEMNRILNVKKFSMDSLTMVICKFENALTDRDGDIRTMSVRYQVISDENTKITF